MADYPCVCCGHLTLSGPPGSYEICPVCFWEDDLVQLRWPDLAGGANKISLIEGQRNFAKAGASEERFRPNVREARLDESVEDGWRLIDPAADSFESLNVHQAQWPDDMTMLYWWRPTFWRRHLRPQTEGAPNARLIPPSPPPRTEVADMIRRLIEGRVSRQEVAAWPRPWITAREPNVQDENVWKALQLLAAADLPTTDREWLYEEGDFRLWLNELLQNDP